MDKAPTHPGEKREVDPTSKYPPPSTHPVFIARWNDFLPSIEGRDNFDVMFLSLLEVLCNLFVEVGTLENFVKENGYTFQTTGGRNGFQAKTYPEVQQLNTSRSEILRYCKMLKIGISNDEGGGSGGSGPSGEKNEWD